MVEGNTEPLERFYWGLVGAGLVDAQKQPFKLMPYTSDTIDRPDENKLLDVQNLAPHLRIVSEEGLLREYEKIFLSQSTPLIIHSDSFDVNLFDTRDKRYAITLGRDVFEVGELNRGEPFAILSASIDYAQGKPGSRHRINVRTAFGEDFAHSNHNYSQFAISNKPLVDRSLDMIGNASSEFSRNREETLDRLLKFAVMLKNYSPK